MKTIIHVDQATIRRNRKELRNDPPLIARTYKGAQRGHSIHVDGPVTFVNSPHKPLKCGARVWAETNAKVTVRKEP